MFPPLNKDTSRNERVSVASTEKNEGKIPQHFPIFFVIFSIQHNFENNFVDENSIFIAIKLEENLVASTD